jgi:hypothetical protein
MEEEKEGGKENEHKNKNERNLGKSRRINPIREPE